MDTTTKKQWSDLEDFVTENEKKLDTSKPILVPFRKSVSSEVENFELFIYGGSVCFGRAESDDEIITVNDFLAGIESYQSKVKERIGTNAQDFQRKKEITLTLKLGNKMGFYFYANDFYIVGDQVFIDLHLM